LIDECLSIIQISDPHTKLSHTAKCLIRISGN
jgi:hypothetical protein